MPRPSLDASQSVSGLVVTSLTTASWTIADKPSRLLVAGAATAQSSPPNITEARWGGSGGTLMTQLGANQFFASFHRNSAWRLVNPTAQSSTLYSAFAAPADQAWLGGSAWYGVDQTNPVGADFRATGSGATGVGAQVAVSDAQPHDVAVDFVWTGNAGVGTSMTLAAAAQHTSLQEQENIGNFLAAAHGWSAGSSKVSVGWVCSSNATISWGTIAFAIRGQGPNYSVSRPWLDAVVSEPSLGARAMLNTATW